MQHCLAHVLSGMGLAECDNIWVACRVTERSCRTRFPLLRSIAELPENMEEASPRDLRGELRHYLKLEHTLSFRANTSTSRAERRAESCGQPESFRGRKENSMVYYKLRLDVWCDWDPEHSDLEEIAQNISAGRCYLYQAQSDCRRGSPSGYRR